MVVVMAGCVDVYQPSAQRDLTTVEDPDAGVGSNCVPTCEIRRSSLGSVTAEDILRLDVVHQIWCDDTDIQLGDHHYGLDCPPFNPTVFEWYFTHYTITDEGCREYSLLRNWPEWVAIPE